MQLWARVFVFQVILFNVGLDDSSLNKVLNSSILFLIYSGA